MVRYRLGVKQVNGSVQMFYALAQALNNTLGSDLFIKPLQKWPDAFFLEKSKGIRLAGPDKFQQLVLVDAEFPVKIRGNGFPKAV